MRFCRGNMIFGSISLKVSFSRYFMKIMFIDLKIELKGLYRKQFYQEDLYLIS